MLARFPYAGVEMTVLLSYHGEESEAALREAMRIVGAMGDKLVVLLAPSDREGAVSAQEAADHLWDRFEAASLPAAIRFGRPDGDIAGQVLELVDEVQATIIVIGLMKSAHEGSLALGKHAKRILLESSVPVLTVAS